MVCYTEYEWCRPVYIIETSLNTIFELPKSILGLTILGPKIPGLEKCFGIDSPSIDHVDVSTSATDCLERLVSEMACYHVTSGRLPSSATDNYNSSAILQGLNLNQSHSRCCNSGRLEKTSRVTEIDTDSNWSPQGRALTTVIAACCSPSQPTCQWNSSNLCIGNYLNHVAVCRLRCFADPQWLCQTISERQ